MAQPYDLQDEELLSIARAELNEDPEKTPEALSLLRFLIQTDPGHKVGKWSLHRADDSYLIMFLRWAKFDAKKALQRLKSMELWIKENSKELGDLTQIKAEVFRELWGLGFLSAVERPAKNGALVFMIQPKKLANNALKDPSLLLKWNFYNLHHTADNPRLQVCGMLTIETFEGMSFFEALKFGATAVPRHIMQANMKFMNSCAPFRLKGIWLFHQATVVTVLMAIVKPFMTQKMKERVKACGSDFSQLHEQIEPSQLPREFGGTRPKEAHWAFFEQLVAAEKEKEAAAAAATSQTAAPAAGKDEDE